MSYKPVETRFALGSQQDLTVPTSTQQYPLGLIYECEDTATKTIKKFMYVYGGSGLTQYVPLAISYLSVAGTEVTPITVAAFASPGSLICVPQVTFASGYYGFVQIQGNCTAAVSASLTALSALNMEADVATAFSSDANTATIDTESSAVLLTTTTDAANVSVYLIGRRAVCPAT